MGPNEIAALYFGLPLAILGVGLRRSLRARGLLLVLASGLGVALYAMALDSLLLSLGLFTPMETKAMDTTLGWLGSLRMVAPMYAGAGLLGGIVAALIRHRGEGALDR